MTKTLIVLISLTSTSLFASQHEKEQSEIRKYNAGFNLTTVIKEAMKGALDERVSHAEVQLREDTLLRTLPQILAANTTLGKIHQTAKEASIRSQEISGNKKPLFKSKL